MCLSPRFISPRRCSRYRRARGRSRSTGWLSLGSWWIVTKILYRIFCKIRLRTWSARSCMYVSACMCVGVCIYAHMRVRGMYMPIMAVKTMYIISRIHAHTGATYRVSICIRYRLCDSRMKASFLINMRNYCKRSKSIFRRFLFFISFFITVSIRATFIKSQLQ